jgi:hypothetical protein
METQTAPNYRYWGHDNIAYGPGELPALVGWIRQGRVTSKTWVYRDDERAWRVAGDWPELKPLLGPKGVAAPKTASGLTPDQLRRIKIFAEMDHALLASLLSYLEAVDVRQWTVLFHKGEVGDAMYSVLSGEVRAREMNEGKETTLFTLGVGESFGELALLIQGERASDIVANTDARLLRLPAAAFAQIIKEAPALATPMLLAIGRTLAHRSRALGDRLTNDLTLAHAAGSVQE